MAGFWHLSHHQMRDLNGSVYAGALAYFYEAATLAPLTVYQDYGLATAHPNPVAANSSGIFPPVFFDEDDGFYRQRLTTSGGVVIPGTDVGTLPIIGPAGTGGGTVTTVDTNSIFATGDVLWLPKSGTKSGWVRDNGRTIGAAGSGATERANADVETLFAYYWNTYSNTLCAVGSGRGANAADDWGAGKTIATLDMRGRAPFGLDDMGNTAASRFTSVPFTVGDQLTAGSTGGEATHTLTVAEAPTGLHTYAFNDPTHSHTYGTSTGANAGTAGASNLLVTAGTGTTNASSTGITSTLTDNAGGGAHNNMPLFVLGTWYRRL